MATLEDFPGKSITEMSPEESIKLIKLIRLRRRIRKMSWKKKNGKELPFRVPRPSPKDVEELLEILGESVDPEFPNAHPIKNYLKTSTHWLLLSSYLEPMTVEELTRYVCGEDPMPPQLNDSLNGFLFVFCRDR